MTFEDLFRTAATVLFGSIATWWTIFTALLGHHRSAVADEARLRLRGILPASLPEEKGDQTLDRWVARLSSVKLELGPVPNLLLRLGSLKWLLGGNLVSSGVLFLVPLLLASPAEFTEDAREVGRYLLLVDIVLSILVCAATIWIAALHEGASAFRELALPRHRWSAAK